MSYEEVKPFLLQGKWGKLPNYEGYFKWNYGLHGTYFLNGDYVTYNIDKEKKRDDWYYII